METGYDKCIPFSDIKAKLIAEYQKLKKSYQSTLTKFGKRTTMNKIIYLILAMIQLNNGSRIVEAVEGFYYFLNHGVTSPATVKIGKSERKTKSKNGEPMTTKPRHRQLRFPSNWIDFPMDIIGDIKTAIDGLTNLKKNTCMYLAREFDCNTHTLRYSYINLMLYEQKKEATLIARHIGHVNTNQLVRYTSTVESKKMLDEEI